MEVLRDGIRRSRGRVTCCVCERHLARGTCCYAQTNVDSRGIWDWRQCPRAHVVARLHASKGGAQ